MSRRAVRGIAVEDAGRADSWEPGGVTSRIVARKWAQEDRDGFVVSARERLRDPSEDARTSAIGVIRAIGAGALLELELGELACDAAMPRAAATAARALGCVDTPGSRSALTKAARSSDARVRANAVESLARLSGPTPDTAAAAVFIECKADRHHRVRASAVRALVERPGGADLSASLADVRAMLDDARGEHRLAGVWVAERVLGGIGARAGSEACERLMERMTELATGDASSAVRARATRCVRRVLVEASYAGGGA
ncbi:MAG: hypothetical protein DHS20C14_22290 [Phycisphaeraceae bacterium]|nr:MAG: hypothetical protein DHS20C14_22290 [Phycisphaeraceae bacterium]